MTPVESNTINLAITASIIQLSRTTGFSMQDEQRINDVIRTLEELKKGVKALITVDNVGVKTMET
jgi:hypothetical protein